MRSFSTVTVGVADLEEVLALWVDGFGFKLRHTKNGPDPQLAKLWAIDGNDIARQALVASPNETAGMLHFVEFNNPDSAVRENANAFDTCPKNLDIYVNDMQAQIMRLKSLGYKFRSDKATEIITDDGVSVREIHMFGHDDINIVLLERELEGLQYSIQGFAGVGPLVTIVNDAVREKAFYADYLNLPTLEHYDMAGRDIEKMIGLPKGAGLHFSILGYPDAPLGRIEVICYDGVEGDDLFQYAQPKHRGILHVSYQVSNFVNLKNRLQKNDCKFDDHGRLNTLAASGNWLSFRSLAGFRVQVVQN